VAGAGVRSIAPSRLTGYACGSFSRA